MRQEMRARDGSRWLVALVVVAGVVGVDPGHPAAEQAAGGATVDEGGGMVPCSLGRQGDSLLCPGRTGCT